MIFESLGLDLGQLYYLGDEDTLDRLGGTKQHLLIVTSNLYLQHLHIDLIHVGVYGKVMHVEVVSIRLLLHVSVFNFCLIKVVYHNGDSANIHSVSQLSVNLITAYHMIPTIYSS